MTSIPREAATPGNEMTSEDTGEDTRVATDEAIGAGTATKVPSLTLGEASMLFGVGLVAAVAAWSLALAQLGRHDGWLAVGLGALTTVAGALLCASMGPRPRISVDGTELALLAAVIAASAFFFLPGFRYAYGDKDPGIYVAHGFAIAREGDVYVDDPVTERGLAPGLEQGATFPGIWRDTDHPHQVTSQFYHLYSSLLATADDIGGPRALFNLTPFLAIGSCCLVVLATRRAAGTVVAVVAGALLVTSMMQVWQAKYPSTEIIAQLFLAGAILAAVLAIDRRWTGGAFIVGLMAGVSFLARPDGFLYVLLAAGSVAIVIAAGRADARVAALIGGLAVSLPYAMWNAYVAREHYSDVNSVPGPVMLVGAIALAVVAGFVARGVLVTLGRRFPRTHLDAPDRLLAQWRVPVGVLLSFAFGALLFLLYFRRQLFGEDYRYSFFSGRVERSFAEMSMPWLSWFVTVRGLVVMWLGACVLLIQRWRASLFALVATGVLLLPLYVYNARVSMRLMWWVRRFVPAVVPVVVILIAIAIGWALTRRWMTVRIAGAVLLATLLVEYVAMSNPLRHHDEMGGSWELSEAIAAQAGTEQGVFLFPPPASPNDFLRNTPGIVWFVFDQVAARLPSDYDITSVDQYGKAFPDQPVFVVAPGDVLPAQLPGDRFTKSGSIAGEVVAWEESRDERPNEAVTERSELSVWELTGRTG